MILTNTLLRTDGLREDATPRQVTPIAVASWGAPEALEQTCAEFRLLLKRDPDEVDVQRFLRRNPILFHRFAPSRILSEAPILTKYRTDFVIVSENKELYLVELEAPSMRLLTRSGQPTAGYTHAFQQVLDWLHEFEDEFSACLRGLNLLPSDVVSVLGVVIAGRDVQHSVDELKRLKWVRHNRVAFYTYDDVLRSAAVLKRSLAEHEPPA
jgi:hypothetical protein